MSDCTATRHHANEYTYRHYGCRCPETVAAASATWCARRVRLKERGYVRPPKDRSVDEIAVDRAVRGWPVKLTVRERGLVVARLTAAGWSAAEIAERVGRSQRQIVRYRAGQIQKARAA